jgi:septal ring factor EnvC (AmiA/AmiB activator)
MNYEKLVDKFREMARDILRLRWISNIKDEILGVDNRLADLKRCNDMAAKNLARANYALSKLDPADPDFADKKAEQEERIKDANKDTEYTNKQVVEATAEKTELTAKIAKITSGEFKVNADNLSAKAKELAEEYMKTQAGLVS